MPSEESTVTCDLNLSDQHVFAKERDHGCFSVIKAVR